MQREINFFGDSSMPNAHPLGSEPDSNSPFEMGMSQHRGDRNYLTRQMNRIAMIRQETHQSIHHPVLGFQQPAPAFGAPEVARRAHAIAMIRQETRSIHHPVLGFQHPTPAFGDPEESMELRFGGGTAARFADDVPFMSVWNRVHVAHSYHMDMPNPIPSDDDEEHDNDDDDLGTGLITRNFLEAMDRPLNPDYANQAEYPELMTVTAPVIDLDPEEVDLELKL